MIVTVDKSDQETAQKLIMDATESKKDADGNWVLTLSHDAWERINKELSLEDKDTVQIERGHKSLESFSSRQYKKSV